MSVANQVVARPRDSRACFQRRLRHPPGEVHRSLQHIVRAISSEQLQYWDVVEYQQDLDGKQQQQQQQLRVGLVQQINPNGVFLCPLVEEDDGVWVADEDVPEQQVPFSSVTQVLDHAFGQRQDKEYNPHGEHAHDVWQLLAPVSAAVYRGSNR